MSLSRTSSRTLSIVAAATTLCAALNAQGLPVTLWSQPGPSFPFANYGEEVAGVGDLDGDGLADWAVGAPGVTVGAMSQAGSATVYFSGGGPSVTINGNTAFERFGESISSAGDQNGDGKPELLIAAPRHTSSGLNFRGRIVLLDGATLSVITQWWGLAANSSWGAMMCSLGDLNGDGKSEYAFNGNVFSVPFTPIPAVYVMDGSNNQVYCAQLQFSNTPNTVPLDIANAGDVTGNGVNDLIVGRGVDTQVFSLASASGVPATLAFTIAMNAQAVAGPGDVDGDGVRDIAISNRNLGPLGGLQGRAMIYSGATQGQLWSVLGLGGQDEFGVAMDQVGDIDGDGNGDIAVGAPQRQPGFLGTGYVRVLSGSNGAQLAMWNGIGGATNATEFGAAVANAGDVDGDGKADFLIGDRGRPVGPQDDGGYAMIAKGELAAGAVGTPFCHCPSSSPASCGNTHSGMGGCLNTFGTPGLLEGFGSTSVASDDLFLVASGLPPSASTFFFSGTGSAAPGIPLYSGLLCVSGTLTRLPVVTASNGVAVKGPYQLVGQGGYMAGQTTYFQAQYRNINGPCGHNANQTNALVLTFTP